MQGITNAVTKREEGGGFPIGTIIECTLHPGDGWVECDGSSTTTIINGLAILFTGTQLIYSGYSSLCKICYGNGIIVTYSESGATNMIDYYTVSTTGVTYVKNVYITDPSGSYCYPTNIWYLDQLSSFIIHTNTGRLLKYNRSFSSVSEIDTAGVNYRDVFKIPLKNAFIYLTYSSGYVGIGSFYISGNSLVNMGSSTYTSYSALYSMCEIGNDCYVVNRYNGLIKFLFSNTYTSSEILHSIGANPAMSYNYLFISNGDIAINSYYSNNLFLYYNDTIQYIYPNNIKSGYNMCTINNVFVGTNNTNSSDLKYSYDGKNWNTLEGYNSLEFVDCLDNNAYRMTSIAYIDRIDAHVFVYKGVLYKCINYKTVLPYKPGHWIKIR